MPTYIEFSHLTEDGEIVTREYTLEEQTLTGHSDAEVSIISTRMLPIPFGDSRQINVRDSPTNTYIELVRTRPEGLFSRRPGVIDIAVISDIKNGTDSVRFNFLPSIFKLEQYTFVATRQLQ